MERDLRNLLNHIAQIIYNKKGRNILALDTTKCSAIANYFLIAEGAIERHVSSIAYSILEELDERPVKIEGLRTGDWVVLDFSQVMVHLFRPGLREKYSLEKLWKKGCIIDLDIKII